MREQEEKWEAEVSHSLVLRSNSTGLCSSSSSSTTWRQDFILKPKLASDSWNPLATSFKVLELQMCLQVFFALFTKAPRDVNLEHWGSAATEQEESCGIREGRGITKVWVAHWGMVLLLSWSEEGLCLNWFPACADKLSPICSAPGPANDSCCPPPLHCEGGIGWVGWAG